MRINPKHIIKKTILSPFEEFLHLESSGGILLLIATLAALFWANSPWSESYDHFWHTNLSITLGEFTVGESLHFWINDGLMAIFFFMVGLEIKREIVAGELSEPKKCLLPILSALGGMLVPALIYTVFNYNHFETAKGWGIPMATDIAFATGVMALLGKRVPLPLKVFLMALAIVDDLGAVLAIAFFYTAQINWSYLLLGFFFIAIMGWMNLSGVRKPLAYAIVGILGAWVCFLLSGVHATVASVLAALTIPVSTNINADEFVERSRAQLLLFKEKDANSILITADQRVAIHRLETLSDEAQSPLQHLENLLHPFVSYIIIPMFALANAGIVLNHELFSDLTNPMSLGIIFGLVFGKPLGILILGWLAVRLKIATLPKGVSWPQILAAGCLAGMGFTMSIFIANLAFPGAFLLAEAKLSVLLASLAAGFLGGLLLLGTTKVSVSKT